MNTGEVCWIGHPKLYEGGCELNIGGVGWLKDGPSGGQN